ASGEAKKSPAAAPSFAAPDEATVARALHERLLFEENRTVREALASALQKFHSRKFFDLALETLSTSTNPLHRDRAAEGIVFALRKEWVDDLIRIIPQKPRWAGEKAERN